MPKFQTKYGYFTDDGSEYVIIRPDTPRPWINVICPGDYGVIVSQTGGGYSWKTNASQNRITRWEQDLIKDNWGKFFYIRDDQTGKYWSLTWQPVCHTPEFYEVVHGIGYSKFRSKYQGVKSQLTVFVPRDEPVEIWQVEIDNDSTETKTLSLFTYLEWNLGLPDPAREFHKIFIETRFDKQLNTIWATKRLWEIPNDKGQHWNKDWEYIAFHSADQNVSGFEGDKERFLGMYGANDRPEAVVQGRLTGTCGKWGDAIASLHNQVTLQPGQHAVLTYLIGAVPSTEQARAEALIKKYQSGAAITEAFAETRRFWNRYLTTTQVKTPDEGFDLMVNTWLKYQTLSGHIWGRTAYYQTGGAYGFRDQLQASQIFLLMDPYLMVKQIKLHAAHQFPEGRVNHWWHPLSELAMENKISDNLLWLPFVVIRYLKETGTYSLLEDKVPFKNGPEATIYEHCYKAIEYCLSHLSGRGLPLIGDGDWNDGMNAVGTEGKGESVWLGHFLYGVLNNFAVVAQKLNDWERKERYLREAARLKEVINDLCWDGDWYIRAVCDDGTVMGSKNCEEGRIFLNAQSWAILNGIAEGERAQKTFRSMDQYLFREYGPLLLFPAYQKPHANIGYLSRYAPGLRENGGVYTHAATWAVLATCKMGLGNRAFQVYKSFLPPYRGLEPDLYKTEPYVNPGNSDGPDSPHFGRGGYSWYTGSSAWSFLVALEGILGLAPDWDGLRINPVIPDEWDYFEVARPYQGATYRFIFTRSKDPIKAKLIYLDGRKLEGDLIKPCHDGKEHQVEVYF